MRNVTVVFCLLFSCICHAKEISLKSGESATLFVRPGFSTSLSFDGIPKSAGLGNQDLVRAEFVGKELLLKPLAESGETNLFVYLEDGERFDFWLKIGRAKNFSYQIKRKYEEKDLLPGVPIEKGSVSKTLKAYRSYGDHRFHLTKVSRYDSPMFVRIDFEIENLSKKKINAKVDYLTIYHLGKVVPLDLVYIETKSINPKKRVKGFIEIHGHPKTWNEPFTLNLMRDAPKPFQFEISLAGLAT